MVRAAARADAGSRRARLTAAKATRSGPGPVKYLSWCSSRRGGPLILGLRETSTQLLVKEGGIPCAHRGLSYLVLERLVIAQHVNTALRRFRVRRDFLVLVSPPARTERQTGPDGRASHLSTYRAERDSATIARDGRLSRFFRSVRRSHSENVRRCSACYVSFP
jgi:hypothetical protein